MAEKRNASIDIARYFCAILVVAIHTEPFMDANRTVGFVAVKIIPNIAVPFFLCISGYYFVKGLDERKIDVVRYILGCLRIYVFWSMVYFLYNFRDVMKGRETVRSFVKQCLVNFFIRGSFFHLWYFPALFFSIAVTWVFWKIGKLKLLAVISILTYILGLLGCSYYRLGNELPYIDGLVNWNNYTVIRRVVFMAMPFFVCGYMILKLEDVFLKMSDRKLFIANIILTVLYFAEIVTIKFFGLNRELIITICLPFVLLFLVQMLLRSPMHDYYCIAGICRKLSGFIYFAHPCVIIILEKMYDFNNTGIFFLTCALCTMIGLVLKKVNKKFINKLY